MKYVVFGFLVFMSAIVNAQVLRSNDENAVKRWYVFADQCNLREKPNADAKVVAKLFAGAEVKMIEGTLITKEVNGISKNWMKISVNASTGYVWGGNLAEHSIKMPGGELAMLGFIKEVHEGDSTYPRIKVWASIRIAKDNKIKNFREFEVVHGSNPKEGYLLVLPEPELDNVRNVMVYCTYAEACGVFSSEHVFFDKEDELYYMGTGYGMGDGGMAHSTKEYTIPFKKQLDDHVVSSTNVGRNRVFRKTEEGESEADCSYTTITKTVFFVWDGESLKKEGCGEE